MKIDRRSPRYGEAGYQRLDHDAYFTIDLAATDAAVRYLGLRDGVVWEPCAGLGHMARVFSAAGRQVVASDLTNHGWPLVKVPFRLGDFLDASPAWEPALAGISVIATNPPFRDGMAERCVRRALDLMAPVGGQVAMLLPHDFDCAADRLDLFDGHPAFAGRLILTWRLRWFEGRGNGPRQNFSWFLWDWRGRSDEPVLRYARRGRDGDLV